MLGHLRLQLLADGAGDPGAEADEADAVISGIKKLWDEQITEQIKAASMT